jgi:TetR/AcrR family transcriptional regulator, transcriptional repressor for nem operon
MPKAAAKPSARSKILDAAFAAIRTKGYAATTVDELCAAAGLAVAAADHWAETTGALFAAAPYHAAPDPLDRVLGYIDFRKALLKGRVPEFTCLVGTMVQEAYTSNPDIRAACTRSICGHAETLEADIAAAMKKYRIDAEWTPASLALHTQAVLQGAFILAKAKGGPQVAADSVDHLRRYVGLLFNRRNREKAK